MEANYLFRKMLPEYENEMSIKYACTAQRSGAVNMSIVNQGNSSQENISSAP